MSINKYPDEYTVRSATNADSDSVRELVFAILREYGLEPDPDGIDSDMDDIEGNYIASGGSFEIIEDREGNLVGTFGLYPFDETRVELRKMYFLPEIRGKGLGKITLTRIIGSARDLGYQQLILETASVLKEAIGLYKKFGFREAVDPHTPRCDKSFFLDL
ncbi:MAG: GNAT family N-acetyltransferase [Pyrinomonadaceae bacterium]